MEFGIPRVGLMGGQRNYDLAVNLQHLRLEERVQHGFSGVFSGVKLSAGNGTHRGPIAARMMLGTSHQRPPPLDDAANLSACVPERTSSPSLQLKIEAPRKEE